MSFTLQNLIDFVRRRVSDDSDGNADLPSIVEYANEGLRRNRRKFDMPPSEHKTLLDLFNGVYRYAPPAGYKDWTQITDLDRRPDGLNFERTTEPDFWRAYLNHNYVADSRDGMSRSLLISLNTPPLTNIQLDSCDTYNYDGTWTADTVASDAVNVATNKLDFLYGGGSVSFGIDVSQSANDYAMIYKTMASPKDLSADTIANIGVIFVDVYLPVSAITSMSFYWGSDNTNYYTRTVTAQWDGSPFVLGWNRVGFDWSQATSSGSPVNSAIAFLAFKVSYANTMTDQNGFKIDNIWIRQRKRVWFHWTSDYLVIDSTTLEPKEQFSSTTDTSSYFACDPAFVDWLGYHVLESVFTYLVKDADARALNSAYLKECEDKLIEMYPSNKPPITNSYMETDDLQDRLN